MSNTNMQAIQDQDYGGPEVLVLKRAPRLQPKADQILIGLCAFPFGRSSTGTGIEPNGSWTQAYHFANWK